MWSTIAVAAVVGFAHGLTIIPPCPPGAPEHATYCYHPPPPMPNGAEAVVSVEEVMRAINMAITKKALESPKYKDYSVKTVSWDDVSRFNDDEFGGLSAFGDNICDTTLHARDGTRLYTVRSDNWNEKLGTVRTRDIRLVEGNQRSSTLEEITLRDFLLDSAEFGEYVGLETESLADRKLDKKVSIRFQTTFLPVDKEDKAKFQFNSQMYNYASSDDKDPRNLILLASSMGIALQQDGEGKKDIYHHKIKDGSVMQHWLEAERTDHTVGGEQKETFTEIMDTLRRNKTRARPIGIPAMGKRFNAVMAIQIPLNQTNPRSGMPWGGFGGWEDDFDCKNCMMPDMTFMTFDEPAPGLPGPTGRQGKRGPPPGVSNAARVSAGDEAGYYDGLGKKSPKRHPTEHITCTVTFYYTVAGGVPSEKDVIAAIDDMENLYGHVGAGYLGDEQFKGSFTTKIKNPEIVAFLREQNYSREQVKKSPYFPEICGSMTMVEKNAFLDTFA